MKTVPCQNLKNIYKGGTLRNLNFKISEYAGHQVGPKHSGSQNFCSLMAKAVGVAQIPVNGGGLFSLIFSPSLFVCLF
jgi:hypothetical protein